MTGQQHKQQRKCPRCGKPADDVRDLPDHDVPMCGVCRFRVEEREYGFGGGYGYEPHFPGDYDY